MLNQDFRATKPRSRATLPAAFQSLVTDAKVEFQLAKRDPDGKPTDGITRTTTSRRLVLRRQTRQEALAGRRGGLAGQAVSEHLGLQPRWRVARLRAVPRRPGANRRRRHPASGFGTTGTAKAPFDLGRTATHEVGHWLNLRHIWADTMGCGGCDRVADTPNAAGPNYGKPTFPHVTCTNGPNGDMFMDYMDYVDDAAMFMFTAGPGEADERHPGGPAKVARLAGMAIDRAAVRGHWLHAHERDSEDEMVLVPADTQLPPSRGRRELELEESGEATEGGPGATDRPEARPARWELTDDDELVIRGPEGEEAWRARVVSAGRNGLVLDKRSIR